jgi:hypothetical protein
MSKAAAASELYLAEKKEKEKARRNNYKEGEPCPRFYSEWLSA